MTLVVSLSLDLIVFFIYLLSYSEESSQIHANWLSDWKWNRRRPEKNGSKVKYNIRKHLFGLAFPCDILKYMIFFPSVLKE